MASRQKKQQKRRHVNSNRQSAGNSFYLTYGTYGDLEGKDWRDTWQVFRIMAEFVSGYQFLSKFDKVATVFGSARLHPRNRYYRDAVVLGRLLSRKGFCVMTGGGPGIMEAANKGAYEAGGESAGLNIQLPFEQRINPYVKKYIAFSYFFTRKVMLSAPAHVYVFYPGGFGTMDELFEILDSMELGLIDQVPVVLVGKEFWRPLLSFLRENVVERHHCIERRKLDMIQLVDSADEAAAIIRGRKVRKNLCSILSVDNFSCGEEINWRIFRIMAEVVTGFEFLTNVSRNITILGTKSIRKESPYWQKAYALGRRLVEDGYTVVTGGGSGIMEAANKGAYEAGGESIGIYTHTIDQGEVNPYLTRSLAFDFSYTRKLILTAPSRAFILFPGGFGTLDQCFEVLTLIQTGKMRNVPVVLFGREYWEPLLSFLRENMFEQKHAIARHDLRLFNIVDSVEDALALLKEG